MSKHVFVTGGSGYLGRPLISRLLERGHEVKALVRQGSEGKLPADCVPVRGNALDPTSYANRIQPADTFVQLVGVSHPNPSKAEQFRNVDLVSGTGAIQSAQQAGIQHFVYLSVAHPAPVMKAYIAVRSECEDRLRNSGLNATVLRPWYVLGPGHHWPFALLPMYWLLARIPSTRDGAKRLGLVTLEQMVSSMLWAIENPCRGVRVLGVPEIRASQAFQPLHNRTMNSDTKESDQSNSSNYQSA
ncbi:MAG TPA: NAD(P)H-binding protein [Terriglobales bacterium]|jgi:uncharacterized protein YbjT (DUF2867 family)